MIFYKYCVFEKESNLIKLIYMNHFFRVPSLYLESKFLALTQG